MLKHMKSYRYFSGNRLPFSLCWGNSFSVQVAGRIKLYDGAVWSELLSLAGLYRKLWGGQSQPSLHLTGWQEQAAASGCVQRPSCSTGADPVTLCGASLNRVKWRGNASSRPPRWLWAILYTNFFTLRRLWILAPHHPQTAFGSASIGKPSHSGDLGDVSSVVFTGLLLCSPVLVILCSPAGINMYKKASSQ